MNEANHSPRRIFLKQTAAATALFSGPNLLLGQVKGANERFRVGVMGLGRGMGHIRGYLDVPNTEVAYKVTDLYAPEQERAFAWNDPDLALPWPDLPDGPVLSEKDAGNPPLRDLGNPF